MSESIEFKIPQGFEVPDGTKPGDMFEAMATLQLGEQGELYLKELDGNQVASDDSVEEGPDEQEEVGFLDAVERRASE